MKKYIKLIIVFIIVQIIPMLANKFVIIFYSSSNVNNSMDDFLISAIHHLVQFFITILFMKYLLKISITEAGFNLLNKDKSKKFLKNFVISWFFIVLIFYILSINFMPGFKSYVSNFAPADYPPMFKDLMFNILLLAGIGEEPLFRSLIILPLIKDWSGELKIKNISIPHLSIISGVIFSLGHIGYNVYPFSITYLDSMNILPTFVLGVCWATFFIRTKSLFSPILAHSCANVIQYLAAYITSFMLI
jgi:membrane protease YdiL (CAAX protease family)